MKRLAPEVLAASKVDWQLFLTLTWRGQVPRPERRGRLGRAYLRGLARKARVPYANLVWLCREEPGEVGGRPHFHVLIAGFPSSVLNFEFGVIVGQLWEHGWCEGRLWHSLGAVTYSCEDGANIYESGKFRAGLPIMLSESLARVVGLATGDNVEREDTEHCENPEVLVVGCPSSTGLDQRQSCVGTIPLFPADDRAEEKLIQRSFRRELDQAHKGKLLAVNVTRTGVHATYQADITGA